MVRSHPDIRRLLSAIHGVRAKCLRCIIILFCLVCVIPLSAVNNLQANGNRKAVQDSLQAKERVVQERFIKDYHAYRLKTPVRGFSLNWLHSDFNLNLQNRMRTITESELYEISYELYSKYYLNRIELYNLNGKAFLYLDLKDAQTRRGALQFSIDLPGFSNLFRKKPNHQGN